MPFFQVGEYAVLCCYSFICTEAERLHKLDNKHRRSKKRGRSQSNCPTSLGMLCEPKGVAFRHRTFRCFIFSQPITTSVDKRTAHSQPWLYYSIKLFWWIGFSALLPFVSKCASSCWGGGGGGVMTMSVWKIIQHEITGYPFVCFCKETWKCLTIGI